MKPFDLGLAKMGQPVQTRGGKSVRIICFDQKHNTCPLVALVSNNHSEDLLSYTEKGKPHGFNEEVEWSGDLFMADYIKLSLHVDDFIDFGTPYTNPPAGEHEARWFLFLHRLPAILQMEFKDKLENLKLFCDYQGVRHRVTGASRMGDVWLTTDFNKDTGYDKRVDVEECSNWGEKELHNGGR